MSALSPPGNAVLDDITTSDLQSLKSRAQDALNTACSQAATDKQIVDCIGKLTTSSSLLKEFHSVAYVDPEIAEHILHAALAALVNAQSLLAVEAELRRRANLN